MAVTTSNNNLDDIIDVSLIPNGAVISATNNTLGFSYNGNMYFATAYYISSRPEWEFDGADLPAISNTRPTVSAAYEIGSYASNWRDAILDELGHSSNQVAIDYEVDSGTVTFKVSVGPHLRRNYSAHAYVGQEGSYLSLTPGTYDLVLARRPLQNMTSAALVTVFGHTFTTRVTVDASATINELLDDGTPDKSWTSTFLRFAHQQTLEDLDSIAIDFVERDIECTEYNVSYASGVRYGTTYRGKIHVLFNDGIRHALQAIRNDDTFVSRTGVVQLERADGYSVLSFDTSSLSDEFVFFGFTRKPLAILKADPSGRLTNEASAAVTQYPEVTASMEDYAEAYTYALALSYQDEEAPAVAAGYYQELLSHIQSDSRNSYEYLLSSGLSTKDALWYAHDYDLPLRLSALSGDFTDLEVPYAYSALMSQHPSPAFSNITGSGLTTNVVSDYFLSQASAITGTNVQDELIWDRVGVAVLSTPLISASYPTRDVALTIPGSMVEGLWFTEHLVIELVSSGINKTTVNVYLRVPTQCDDASVLPYINGAIDETASALRSVYASVSSEHVERDAVASLATALSSIAVGTAYGAATGLLSANPYAIVAGALVGAGIGGLSAAGGSSNLVNASIQVVKAITNVIDDHITVSGTAADAVRKSLPYAFMLQLDHLTAYDCPVAWHPGVHLYDSDALNRSKAIVGAIACSTIAASVGCLASWTRYTRMYKRKSWRNWDKIVNDKSLTVQEKAKQVMLMRDSKCWPVAIYSAFAGVIAAASGHAISTTKQLASALTSARDLSATDIAAIVTPIVDATQTAIIAHQNAAVSELTDTLGAKIDENKCKARNIQYFV